MVLDYFVGRDILLQYYYMKRILLLCAALLPLSYSPLFSQIYRAGDYYYSPQPKPAVLDSRLEITADAFIGSNTIKELSGITLLRSESGLGMTVLYALAPWVSAGLEGAVSRSEEAEPLLHKYSFMRWGAAAKFTLTPSTAPRTYILIGAGLTRHKTEYLGGRRERKDSPYTAVGLGAETDLTDAWFIGMEGRGIYHFDRKIGTYFYLKHRWNASFRVHTGIRF